MKMIVVTYFDKDHSIMAQKRHSISNHIEEADDAFGFCDDLSEGQYLLINRGFDKPVIFDHEGQRV